MSKSSSYYGEPEPHDEKEQSPDELARERIAQLERELAEERDERDKLSGTLLDSLEAMAEFERLALMRNRYREPLLVALHIRVMIDKIVKALKSTSSSLWQERATLRERDKRSRELLRTVILENTLHPVLYERIQQHLEGEVVTKWLTWFRLRRKPFAVCCGQPLSEWFVDREGMRCLLCQRTWPFFTHDEYRDTQRAKP